MNDKLTIGVSTSPDKLMKMIKAHLPVVELDYNKELGFINMDTGKDIITIIKLSDVLTEYIMGEFEKKQTLYILKEKYDGLNIKEKREISNLLDEMLRKDSLRRSIVLNSLFSYIKDKNKVMLEGFFNFRLYEYRRVLEDMIDDAVREYLAEREYEEFVSLIKQFVDAQSSMLDVMHIVSYDNGTYRMYNGKGDDITEKCFDELRQDMCFDAAFDDVVITSLVYMSPQKIIIHNHSRSMSKELVRTIERVFTDRVEYCEGCYICNENDGEGV